MSDIPERVKRLSDVQLRSELAKVGVNAGPVTPTTRRLFQTRLAKKLGFFSLFLLSEEKNETKSESQTSEIDGTDLDARRKDSLKDDTADSLDKATTSKLHKEPISETKSESEPKKDASKAKTVDTRQLYYGVFVPGGDHRGPMEPVVFESKSSTILSIKEHKDARFKVFTTYEDAKTYSMKGTLEDAKKSTSSILENENDENKYKTPKQEELNRFMHLVEKGETDEMRRLIWENPKYIVNSADGPVVLKASARYNALHVAAKFNQPGPCVEILSTLENLDYHALLYPKVTDMNVIEQRIEHFLDSYLNTPEKGMYETPLHIACKMGFKDVVSELVAYNQCSTMVRNKFGDTPHGVICSRAPDDKVLKTEIERMLGDQYFVPLLRYHDNSEHAIIGTPMNAKHRPEEYAAMSPVLTPQLDSPIAGASPLRPTLTVSALAGPMTKEQAAQFQKVWTTPSRREGLGKSLTHLRRTDSEKGDEHIGRQLAVKERVGWVEYWDFISDFVNFGTDEGLLQLEEYLSKKQDSNTTISLNETPSEIRELTSMLENVRINDSDTKQSTEPQQVAVAAKKLVEVALENTGETAMEIEDVKVKAVENAQHGNSEGKRCSSLEQETHSGNKYEVQFDDTNLVKKLFAEEKNVVKESNSDEAFSEEFSKSLTISADTKTPGNEVFVENWFSKAPKDVEDRVSPDKQYRCADSISSDVFSSPEQGLSSESLNIGRVRPTFLTGEAPTKLDRDVLMAIAKKEIDDEKYPNLCRWKADVLSFSENERQHWGTPRKKVVSSRLTPQSRSISVSGALSSPSLTPGRGSVNNFSTPHRNMKRYLYRSFTSSIGE